MEGKGKKRELEKLKYRGTGKGEGRYAESQKDHKNDEYTQAKSAKNLSGQ